MGRFVNVFALSIFRDKIALDADYKAELVRAILDMEQATPPQAKSATTAWLGDTRGFEFLFSRPEFGRLYREIAAKVLAYTEALGIDNELVEFFFQRSWATISRRGERISEHAHEQSNITFAYYLAKPAYSGGVSFNTYDHPNELARGLFSPKKASLGLIKTPSMHTWNTVQIEPDEDEIVIFPSKTLHATAANATDTPRISISADISMLLRDSRGHETMMPHFSNWRSFDGL
ncbi:MAG: putative 2OG-Fe(II) oxygenase [Pirellulales bacterium]